MPEVEFALLANAAQVTSDRLISMLGGGWDTAAVPEEAYPASIVLTVALRLRFEEDELGKTHAGEITASSEAGERLATVTFTVTPQAGEEELPPGWKQNVPLVAPVPVQFPSPGVYAVSIAIGGIPLKTLPLRMKVAGA